MYLWIKAFHVIAVTAWMAGMFYLPRLYVYHAEAAAGSPQSETFKVMERRLLRIIINPAMIATWVLGLYLVFGPDGLGLSGNGWLHIKIALVVAMTVFHIMLSKWRKEFERDENRRSPKFYRLANEVPPVLMVFIVILVIVKPF
ncbi:MAG: protoporphyrinogen oxidase HemJ [Hyphomicrobiales bacterium]|nr:protoporphyrinogen oxidase HemJ [Hyphomicrobiales bacterium]